MGKKEEIDEVFNEFDTDKSGFIDVKEIKEALKKTGVVLTDQQAQQFIDAFDEKDKSGKGDGKMSKEEFIKLCEETEKC
jgi:Ca2+-binding EF-hand superfamily protein